MAIVEVGLWNIIDAWLMQKCGWYTKEADKYALYKKHTGDYSALGGTNYSYSDSDWKSWWSYIQKKLSNHFQNMTWANKLSIWHKFYSFPLQEGGSVSTAH